MRSPNEGAKTGYPGPGGTWFRPVGSGSNRSAVRQRSSCSRPPKRSRGAAGEKDEAFRLAYVAATRARDLLMAPVCRDRAIESWFSVLDPALYPPNAARSTALPLPAPALRRRSGRGSRPIRRRRRRQPRPARPGQHRPMWAARRSCGGIRRVSFSRLRTGVHPSVVSLAEIYN